MPLLTQARAASPEQMDEMANAEDVTAPGAAAGVSTAPPSAEAGVQIAREEVNRGDGAGGEEGEASPEEQAEYERVLGAINRVMYGDENTSQSIADQLQPQDKIGSTVKASLLLMKQIDEKVDMDEVVIPQITQEVADRMIDLGEQVKGMQFSEQEVQAVAGATWEGVMEIFGVDPDSYEELTQGMSPEQVQGFEKEYNGYLGS